MHALRLLAVFPMIVMLTGCMIESDVRALRSDIKALKVYLASTPLPDQCLPPGEQQSSKRCYYKLQITDNKDQAHGRFTGRVHPDVFKANAADCPKVNETLLPEYKSLAYDCPPLDGSIDFSKNSHFYPDTEIEYTFNVDGNPMLSVGPSSVDFESIPDSKHLRQKP